MKTPILQTQDLILRPLTTADAQEVYNNWTSDAHVAKYMVWELHTCVEDTVAWLKDLENNNDKNNFFVWGFVLKKTNEIIGSAGIIQNNKIENFDIAYNIMKKHWGSGYTTQGTKAMLEFAKTTLNLKEISAKHAKENVASQKVLEKLGFIYVKDGEYKSVMGKKSYESRQYLLLL